MRAWEHPWASSVAALLGQNSPLPREGLLEAGRNGIAARRGSHNGNVEGTGKDARATNGNGRRLKPTPRERTGKDARATNGNGRR